MRDEQAEFRSNANFYAALDGAYYRVMTLKRVTRLTSRYIVARYAGPNRKPDEQELRPIGSYATSEKAHHTAERLAAQERGS